MIGLLAQASARTWAVAQTPPSIVSLGPLSAEIPNLAVESQPSGVVVSIGFPARRTGSPPSTRPRIQVWLLKSDGNAVIQKGVSGIVGGVPASSSSATDFFRFNPVQLSELAGVVVSIDGKLYVREIKPKP
jgi:hypothetical protein